MQYLILFKGVLWGGWRGWGTGLFRGECDQSLVIHVFIGHVRYYGIQHVPYLSLGRGKRDYDYSCVRDRRVSNIYGNTEQIYGHKHNMEQITSYVGLIRDAKFNCQMKDDSIFLQDALRF